MITLVTGGPGTGKTAWLISQLLDIKKTQPYREFFIHGIRDFTGFKHTTVYCRSPLCDLCQSNPPEYELDSEGTTRQVPRFYLEDWPTWYKSHFLIVADEVQRIWGTKLLASNVDAVSRLQTHRHYGLDFWLVSQSPKLIHTDVKAMVGRHIHLVAKWSGRKEFEWPEIRDNINARTDAVERPYKLPKKVFSMYSSAEVHTKQDKRMPLSVYAMIAAIVIALSIGWILYKRINARVEATMPSPSTLPVDNGTPKKTAGLAMSSAEDVAVAMTPVVMGLPWTAPVYKDLVKPVAFPQLKGCVKSNNLEKPKCNCYTQQATLIVMPAEVCIDYIKHKSFNHFIPDPGQLVDEKNPAVTLARSDSPSR